MTNVIKKLGTFSLAAFFALSLAACADNDAEEAGEKIDEIVTDAGNAIEDACEDVKENADAKDKDC
ncbi:hypothetical protein ACFO4O_09830 [Glaciecola siphonariae]|uniref:Lipoprotein n=1 Tax=Glaciecola siphonariae TaxID=521012 RepID=A0ABV9LVB4_9ALTE